MNLVAVPLLLIALLMAGGDGELRSAELLLAGEHEVVDQRGVLIIGDTDSTVPAGTVLPGPIYLIGGELVVRGTVSGDVVQLAGALRLRDAAAVEGELRRIGGTLSVAPGARVGRVTTLQPTGDPDDPTAALIATVVMAALLAAAGAALARRDARPLCTVGEALTGHPVVALTVGVLLALTTTALLVFMAFTVVLIPVAIAGLLVALGTLAYAVVACGHLLGALAGERLGLSGPAARTAVGVLVVIAWLRVVGEVPVAGAPLTLAVVLAAVGAVVLTYFGVAPFRPATMPD